MLVKILPVILMIVVPVITFSQRVYINGKEGDRPLTWKDFGGRPDKSSQFGAYTFTFYKTTGYNFSLKGDTVIMNKPIEYWVELGKDSWVKEEQKTDTLLQHEEGHFLICKLLVLELNAKMRSTVFLKNNIQLKINAIQKEVSDKYKAMEKMYDQETDHSKNRQQQWKWNAFFQKELLRLRSPDTDIVEAK